jgi:hypothetical protein
MPLSKIQGIDGQVTPNLGRRNLLINGEFQIFQRATSATNPGGGYDTADRWRSSQNSGGLGNYNAEQSTDTPNGFGFSYKLTKSGVETQNSGNSAYIEQYIEGQNVQHLNYGSSSAKKLTASFHVKSSVTGTYGCFLGDGTSNGKKNVQTFTISSANTWEKKVLTFNGDTATALDNDNSAELVFGIVLGAGTNYHTGTTNSWLSAASPSALSTSSQTQWPQTDGATFFMTGIQLEVGDTATDFEHRSFGEELSLCQRYYCKSNSQGTNPGTATGAGAVKGIRGDGTFVCNLVFPQEMRAAPTITLYSPTTGASGKCRNLAGSGSDETSSSFDVGTRNAGFTMGSAGLHSGNTVHFEATAEL